MNAAFAARRAHHHGRSSSFSSDEGSLQQDWKRSNKTLEEPVLIYHESARSIVFRDHLRRAVVRQNSSSSSKQDSGGKDSNAAGTATDDVSDLRDNLQRDERAFRGENGGHHNPHLARGNELEEIADLATGILDPNETVALTEAGVPPAQIAGYQPKIVPLAALELGPADQFEPLLNSYPPTEGRAAAATSSSSNEFTAAEREVCRMLQEQRCTVKTIKNTDWGPFLKRFLHAQGSRGHAPKQHDDIAPADGYTFNSFVTSTSMLPEGGKRMRCYGSANQYTTGVIFALPNHYADSEEEDNEQERTETWSWPAGYSAKTEFNIDGRGRLINGRQEALRPLSILRSYNYDYVHKDEYMLSNRLVSGLSQIPYNEVFLRVGGVGRLVDDKDVVYGSETPRRSFDRGVGLPVALFVRTATFGHLISLLRTRARLVHVLGERHIKGIPLLMITPDDGVRILTESHQSELWRLAATNLNPFQNSTIAHKTTVDNTTDESFQQKVDELIDLDETIRGMLTPEELARLAGGFGATDDSIATILKKVMMEDRKINRGQRKGDHGGSDDDDDEANTSHRLQDVVNEGLAAAVRSGDYHTSRQLLILYSLVASRGDEELDDDDFFDREEGGSAGDESGEQKSDRRKTDRSLKKQSSMGRDAELMKNDLNLIKKESSGELSADHLPAPPPPPPLDTDRLRSATNSDGLLAVLGAAEVLKAIQNGSAKRKVQEVISAVEEWVNYGEQSVAFRISSWYDQRAAQGDLKIATEEDSKFMAFISNKAISNRKAFAQQLREAVEMTDFNDLRFLEAIDDMLSRMHAPCLRLELLQYVLGLDNRYSVAHVARSVELAATCLGISRR
jgi:hypothetical protein